MIRPPRAFSEHSDDALFGGGSAQPSGLAAGLAAAGLPLEAGLRALGEEAPSRQVRRLLKSMSRELERGEPLDKVLSRPGHGLPSYLRGLVRAGLQTGQLGACLEQFLQSLRRRRSAALSFWGMMAYPLLLVPLSLLLGLGALSVVIPEFREIFNDFGINLPGVTLLLIHLASTPVMLSLVLGILAVVLLALLLIVLGPYVPGHALRLRLFQKIPLAGTPSRMRGLSEFCSLLGLLVSGRIPLPDALRMTASAVHDANLRQGALRLAARIEQGESLELAACELPQIGRELRHLFRWESRGEAFGEILLRAGEIYSSRTRVQAGLAIMVFQPLVFVCVALVLGFVVLALFMPLIKLLNELA